MFLNSGNRRSRGDWFWVTEMLFRADLRGELTVHPEADREEAVPVPWKSGRILATLREVSTIPGLCNFLRLFDLLGDLPVPPVESISTGGAVLWADHLALNFDSA